VFPLLHLSSALSGTPTVQTFIISLLPPGWEEGGPNTKTERTPRVSNRQERNIGTAGREQAGNIG